MARTVTQNADLRFRGRDAGVKKSIDGVKRGVLGLPPAFSKGTASLSAFGGAAGQMGGRLTSLASMMSAGGPLVVGIAVATAAFVGVTTKMWSMAKSAADAGDKIFDLSRKFGLTTEFVSRMQFVADQSGSSIDSLGTAIRTLSKNAATNSAEFKKWGVALADANGNVRTSEELFFDAVNAINELEGSTLKTAAAQDLFGRSGTDLLQVIHLGEEGIRKLSERSDELGHTMSARTAVEANAFNNALAELSTATGALNREIIQDMIPAFERIVRVTISVVSGIREHWDALKNLASILMPVVGLVRLQADALGFLADQLGIMDDVTRAAEESEKSLKDQIEESNKARVDQKEKIKDTTKALREHQKLLAENEEMLGELLGEAEDVLDARIKREEKYYKDLGKLADGYAAHRHAMAVKVSNEDIKLDEERTARAKELAAQRLQVQQAVAAGMISAMGTAAASMITDSENAHKHMMTLILDSVQMAVTAYAVQAGAAAGASVAWAPYLIPVVAGAAIAVIRALLTQMPSYQLGGVVPGFDTGRDSVVASMRPGERVFTPEQNERMVRAIEGGGGTGSPTIIFQSVQPATSAEASRAARVTLKMLKRAQARGF